MGHSSLAFQSFLDLVPIPGGTGEQSAAASGDLTRRHSGPQYRRPRIEAKSYSQALRLTKGSLWPSRSDNRKFALTLNGAFDAKMLGYALKTLTNRKPSKLMTRVRFP